MKYILTLILAMAFFRMDAQNLQFSQVLTLTGQVSGNYQTTLLGTVPEGKVWKIESLNAINNDKYFEVNGVGITSTNYLWPSHFPIWLKSQDILSCKSSSGSEYFVSIIEFTLIP